MGGPVPPRSAQIGGGLGTAFSPQSPPRAATPWGPPEGGVSVPDLNGNSGITRVCKN